MANEIEYSTIIAVYMQLFAYSDYCNVKRPVWSNFPPFLLFLCKTAVMFLPSCFLLTLLQLLQAILEKQATIRANMDHTEILDEGSQ